MADISKVTLPNKQTYNFKDASARQHSASADTLTRVDVQSGDTANYPYHRFAYAENVTNENQDIDSVFLIRSMYDNGAWGIIKISLRTNSENPTIASEKGSSVISESGQAILAESNLMLSGHWLARENFEPDSVQFGLIATKDNSCSADVFIRVGANARTEIIRLSSSANSWTMCSSSESSSGSTNCYSSLSNAATSLYSVDYTVTGRSEDRSTVNYANSAGDANTVNGYSVNADVPKGAAFTDKTSLNTLFSTVKELKKNYDDLREQFDALAKIVIVTEA